MELTIVEMDWDFKKRISIPKFIWFGSRYKHKSPITKTIAIYFSLLIVPKYIMFVHDFSKKIFRVYGVLGTYHTFGNITANKLPALNIVK